MAFPETRLTLIGRVSTGGTEQDWQQFLSDYWEPVCQFARRHANLSVADAEDVASKTFEALLTNSLLQRWHECNDAKLRTLLCQVVRNILSNSARVEGGRKRRIEDELTRGANALEKYLEVPTKGDVDLFYTAWVDQLLQTVADQLMREFHSAGKGDYFRVLYGRLCDGMTMAEVSTALAIKLTDAENYYRAARKRLGERLEQHVREHIARSCAPDEIENEFQSEWRDLGEYLKSHGGLEEALGRISAF